jgi:CheY-like chemotaxis protein
MPTNAHRHVVITVHGIRTYGEWQARLEKLVAMREPNIQFCHFRYNYFSMLAFWFPPTRWLQERRFARELREIVVRLAPDRLDLVGHSFGTYLVGWALRRLGKNIQVHTVVLAGSVLRSSFYWADLLSHSVRRVINDCGARDTVLLASQFLVLSTGMAGRIGFVSMTGHDFSNRYSLFGHGGYFNDASGRPSDAYMTNHWVPLIVDENPVPQFDTRSSPNAWRGFAIWLANNFELVKLVYILTPLVALLIWVSAQYILANAAEERAAAVVDLGKAMERDRPLPEEAKPYVETLRQALRIPLHRTGVLWLDDNPGNNVLEKRALQRFGLCFVEVASTDKAIEMLTRHRSAFSVVISDFRREADPRAGYGLLDEMKSRNLKVPVIYYVGEATEEQTKQARDKGAQNQVTDPMQLWSEVLKAISPDRVPISNTQLVLQKLRGCHGL